MNIPTYAIEGHDHRGNENRVEQHAKLRSALVNHRNRTDVEQPDGGIGGNTNPYRINRADALCPSFSKRVRCKIPEFANRPGALKRRAHDFFDMRGSGKVII